ncbi:MAG: amidohydrolase family protein [Thermomicrobiales bacterium]
MPLDLSLISVIDQHCHQWRRPGPAYAPETYRPLFSEGVDGRIGDDVPATVYYRWTIRELARVFECDATENAVLATRAKLGHEEVARRLMVESRVEAAVIDFGFAGRGTDLYTVAEMGDQLGGAATFGALRLESFLEELIVESADVDEVEERFRTRLDRQALRVERIVSLKSIAAYRGGLAIGPADQTTAYQAFAGLKSKAIEAGSVRVADRTFLDYFLHIALAWASAERFPFQFHTGFGDPDVYLLTGNPIALGSVLQDERYRDVPLVLLHAGWPYVRELSYLAGVYPNVYLDLGLAIPFAATEYETVIRQALSLAPSTRVLYSSDGFAIPEHCWFAAAHGRRALASVLDELIERGAIDEVDAMEMADQILRSNASRLYELDGMG